MAEEEFALPENAVANASHLTDTSHVFASVTPWSKGTQAKMNLYAIYQKPEKQTQGNESTSADSSSSQTDENSSSQSGCGAMTTLGVLPALLAAAFVVERKKK